MSSTPQGSTMLITKHMAHRMKQRQISIAMVRTVLDDGYPINGEKISLTPKEIKNTLSEIDFEIEFLRKKRKLYEKINKRGGATVISKKNKLITTYALSH